MRLSLFVYTGESVVFAPEVVSLAKPSDAVFLNLECCISDHYQRWSNPHKPFFFRAPPVAVEELKVLGVDGVTLGKLVWHMYIAVW